MATYHEEDNGLLGQPEYCKGYGAKNAISPQMKK